MMAPIVYVPDASVLLKWALRSHDEEDSEIAQQLMRSWLAGHCQIIVPSLWIYEVGNILGSREPRLAQDLLAILVGYRFEEEHPANVYPQILNLMTKLKVTFYDAAYHATALRHSGTFVTADARYYKKASEIGHVVQLRDLVITS